MTEFWFFIGILSFTTAVCGVWVMGKVVFERWLNNDWCRHNWGMWETAEGNSLQLRFCTKCNKMEKRTP